MKKNLGFLLVMILCFGFFFEGISDQKTPQHIEQDWDPTGN